MTSAVSFAIEVPSTSQQDPALPLPLGDGGHPVTAIELDRQVCE
jgi:hypothetical protein